MDRPGAWPSEQLRLCGEYGVFEWFLSTESGGQGWSEADVMRGYLELSAACLTTRSPAASSAESAARSTKAASATSM